MANIFIDIENEEKKKAEMESVKNVQTLKRFK